MGLPLRVVLAVPSAEYSCCASCLHRERRSAFATNSEASITDRRAVKTLAPPHTTLPLSVNGDRISGESGATPQAIVYWL
jgi:hypothetical protein